MDDTARNAQSGALVVFRPAALKKKIGLFRVSSGSRFGVPGFQVSSAALNGDRHSEGLAIPQPVRAVVIVLAHLQVCRNPQA
jgi:hypothetical protein